jgi:hypothetical protein
MFLQLKHRIKEFKKDYPFFFIVYVLVFVLYAGQLLLRMEITPLGYFSLYSQPMMPQTSYVQNLPFDKKKNLPIDIYHTNGTSFLIFEIVPTRYEVLSNAPFCNPAYQKLKQFGVSFNNEECQNLKSFEDWFYTYCKSQNLEMPSREDFEIRQCYFKNGKLLSSAPIVK